MPKFIVTTEAGREVAGGRNPGAGETLDLTEKQAEHPLRIGHIVRKENQGGVAKPSTTATSKRGRA